MVKPADVDSLVRNIEDKLSDRQPHRPLILKRVATVLRDGAQGIIEDFLTRSRSVPELAAVQVSDTERTDHIPDLLAEIISRLEHRRNDTSTKATKAAQKHGRARKKQGYTVPLLYEEGRILRRCIYESVRNNLLAVNLSFLVADLIEVSESLDTQLTDSVKAFLSTGEKPKAA